MKQQDIPKSHYHTLNSLLINYTHLHSATFQHSKLKPSIVSLWPNLSNQDVVFKYLSAMTTPQVLCSTNSACFFPFANQIRSISLNLYAFPGRYKTLFGIPVFPIYSPFLLYHQKPPALSTYFMIDAERCFCMPICFPR